MPCRPVLQVGPELVFNGPQPVVDFVYVLASPCLLSSSASLRIHNRPFACACAVPGLALVYLPPGIGVSGKSDGQLFFKQCQ